MAIGTTAAIIGGSVLGAGASVIAGGKAAGAQKDAAARQERLANDQIAEERRQFDLTRSDFAPYRETGTRALDTLSSLYGVNPSGRTLDPSAAVAATPGYQFRMAEGLKAIDRSNAARGVLNSGGADKARLRFAEGLAADEYGQYANRLAALAGVGQSATGSTAAAGQAAVGGIANARGAAGNAIGAAGNARASSYANTGAAITGITNNLASAYLTGAFGGGRNAYGVAGSGGIY